LGGYSSSVTALLASGSDFYACGWCWSGNNSNTQVPGYWKNNVWAGPTSGSTYLVTTSIALSGGNVYMGGYGTTTNSFGLVFTPLVWGGSGSLPYGLGGGQVLSIVLSGTDIYAGGYNTAQVGGIHGIILGYPGYWLNNTWTPLDNSGNGGTVNSMVSFGGTIYFGGSDGMGVDGNGSPVSQAGYWTGGSWVGLTLTITGGPKIIALTVTASGVFACGSNGTTQGYWSNGTWTPLSGTVTSIAVSGNDVYVGGNVGATPGYWKNGAWAPLTPLDVARGGVVTSIVVQ
jgi:hypothetical protein